VIAPKRQLCYDKEAQLPESHAAILPLYLEREGNRFFLESPSSNDRTGRIGKIPAKQLFCKTPWSMYSKGGNCSFFPDPGKLVAAYSQPIIL
jgi:hypothetical protein